MAINPTGLTLRQYADATMLDLTSSWGLGKLERDADWQLWATGLVRAPPFSQQNLPDPYQFADWREWAMRVYPLIEQGDN